ncbi:hypothetical protein KQX54_014673 [Cotesia glomerata]|uniref:Uncharacterized protein n=1 Tax=Cotesia glomerata TaxID=32391 RepID=A0AAV7J8E6_COTGL|nr:hypothetical protein KQX54_014673 [Cotesia glomerata]
MDQTWLMTGLELPINRLIRYQEHKYKIPGVRWDPAVDETSPPDDDLESTLPSERSEIVETGKLIEIAVDINQTSQSSIQSSCQDLIERVDEILSSSSCLIQKLASSGGFAKHESFESLD